MRVSSRAEWAEPTSPKTSTPAAPKGGATRRAHAAFRTEKYTDSRSLLSARDSRVEKERKRKRIACCSVGVFMLGVLIGVCFFIIKTTVVVPEDTSEFVINEVLVGSSASGSQAAMTLCSYSLPMTVYGELPRSVSVPSFVKLYEVDSEISLTDDNTGEVLFTSTSLSIGFISSSTFKVDSLFDFEQSNVDLLSSVLSKHMKGNDYSLTLKVQVKFEAYALFAKLSTFDVNVEKVITNVPQPSNGDEDDDKISDAEKYFNNYRDSLTAVLSDVSITKRSETSVLLKPTIDVFFPTKFPVTMELPEVTFDAKNKDGVPLAQLSLSPLDTGFTKGEGKVTLNAYAEPETDKDFFWDTSEIAFRGNGDSSAGCMIQDIMNGLEVTFSSIKEDPESESSDSEDPYVTPASKLERINIKSLNTIGDQAYDLMKGGVLSLQTIVDFTLPMHKNTGFKDVFPKKGAFTVTIEDEETLMMQPSNGEAQIALTSIVGKYSEEGNYVTLHVDSNSVLDPVNGMMDFGGSKLDFVTVDERFEIFLKKFWNSSDHTDVTGNTDTTHLSDFNTDLFLSVEAVNNNLHITTTIQGIKGMYDESVLTLPKVLTGELFFNSNRFGSITQKVDDIAEGVISFDDAQIMADAIGAYLDKGCYVQMVGENVNMNLTFQPSWQDEWDTKITSKRRLNSNSANENWKPGTQENSTYSFTFPSFNASSETYLKSLSVVDFFTSNPARLEKEEFELGVYMEAMVDLVSLLDPTSLFTDTLFSNFTVNVTIPEVDIHMYTEEGTSNDVANSAAGVFTEEIKWSSLDSGLHEVLTLLSASNKKNGLINSLLKFNEDDEDIRLEFRGYNKPDGSKPAPLNHFLGDLTSKLGVVVTFEREAGEGRHAEAGSALNLNRKALEFLHSYGNDNEEEEEVELSERKLQLTTDVYTGSEQLGLKSSLISKPDLLSFENTLFVWPHLYELPFDIFVGKSQLNMKSGENETASVTIPAFNLTKGGGGVIDCVFNVTHFDSLKTAVSLFFDSVVPPTYHFSGKYKPLNGEERDVHLDILKPAWESSFDDVMMKYEDVRRKLGGEDIEEIVKIDVFGGGELGEGATIPCVVPELCADSLIDSAASSLNVVVTILALDLPSWMMWGLDLPDFSIDIRTLTYTKVSSVTLFGSSVDNSVKSSGQIAFNAKLDLIDPSTLYDSLKPVIDPNDDSGLEPIYRFHPSDDANMFSYIFSGVETVINPKDYMRRRKLSGSGGEDDTCESTPLTNEKNFFHPTKCQDSWRVVESSAEMVKFEFDLIHPPLPVRVELDNVDIGVIYNWEKIYQVTTKESKFAVGAAECEGNICPPQTIEITLFNTPTFGKFHRRFVASGMEAIADPGAAPNPLDFQVVVDFDTPCKQKWNQPLQCSFVKDSVDRPVRQRIITSVTLFEESWGGARDGGYGRRSLTGGSTCDNPDYTNAPCCNECVNDYEKMFSDLHMDFSATIYQSLDFWNGLDVVFELEICNILNFDIFVGDIEVEVLFDDLDGYDGWFLSGAEAADEIELVSLTNDFSNFQNPDGWRIKSGNCSVSPQFTATIPSSSTTLINRLYDEAYMKGRLCLQTLGNFTVGFGAQGNEVFKWKQPIVTPTVNVLGALDNNINICSGPPSCNVEEEYAAEWDGAGFYEHGWALTGGAEITTEGNLLLRADEITEVDYPSAWWNGGSIDVVDDWSVNFTIAEETTSGTGTSGVGFCFVLQNDDDGLSAKSTVDGGYGYDGISNSIAVCFNVEGSNSAHIFVNGDTSEEAKDPISNSAYSWSSILDLDDVPKVKIIIQYEAVSQKLLVKYPDDNNENEVLMEVKIDIKDKLGASSATVGFVAEEVGDLFTSLWGNSEFTVSDFKVTTAQIELDKTLIEGSGRVRDLRSGTIYIDSRNSCGGPLRTGGRVSEADVQIISRSDGRSVESLSLTDLADGRYKLDYVGCDEDSLGIFEWCSMYDGRYDIIIEGVSVGSVRLLTGDD
ncbi:hypothetical protein TL16_g07496 [Triparma laevis f. inornata]|uniref:Uncharacterized protein n=1 Tax=Triparma laevis f. inornata TaxID=1714386 RepID=A0A9W7AR65_9STRA|nr:hypothetical protein TL16_g07496 [Triparma laevis f. inornata]